MKKEIFLTINSEVIQAAHGDEKISVDDLEIFITKILNEKFPDAVISIDKKQQIRQYSVMAFSGDDPDTVIEDAVLRELEELDYTELWK